MDDLFETLAAQDTGRCIMVSDPPSGLRAFLVIDDTTLGPAAGGVRTRRYASTREALSDAALLARAMTLKCALAGLSAGGGKAVVMEHAGLDRARAFRKLGERIEELGGLFRTAGDLGTTDRDLALMAETTRYVTADGAMLADAVARGVLACIGTCARRKGVALAGLRVAVQGAGSIGAALSRALAREGAHVIVSDLDIARARVIAGEVGGEVCSAGGLLLADVDVIAPCATGGVIDLESAQRMRAWALCGAANNSLGDPHAGEVLRTRNIMHVPDLISSAGGVICGLSREVGDRGASLINALGDTAHSVLDEAEATSTTPQRVAEARAWTRIRSVC